MLKRRKRNKLNHVDNPFKSPAVLSLCTGMRGLEKGIERSIGNVRTVAYVEIEAFIIENLVQQMEKGILDPAPVWSNVKTFPSQQFHGKIHGITGGYPCQPFSNAGKREGENPRHLWPHIKAMVGTIRPVWCFFENVAAHLTLGYREVKSDLEQMGYTVKEGIYSALEVGAPHRRERLFILAVANTYCQQSKRSGRSGEVGSKKAINHSEENKRQRIWHTIGNGSENMANTELIGYRSELGYTNEQRSQEDRHNDKPFEKKIIRTSGTGFPSGPGRGQYEWEFPRVESRMVYAINGYNFREDLLRMAGNAVVQQTAELAFRILLGKHGLI